MNNNSSLCFITIPFEISPAVNSGTGQAPFAILQELERLDSFELDMGYNPFSEIKQFIINPLGLESFEPEKVQNISMRTTTELLQKGCFPILLGGDNFISSGPIAAARDIGRLGIVNLNAHANLEDFDPMCSKCVMHSALGLDCQVLNVGLRAGSIIEEKHAIDWEVNKVDGRNAATKKDWYNLIDKLPERIYLAIDLNVFDPLCAPHVHNPVPGGPDFHAVIDFINFLFNKKNVVAADITGLSPSPGDGQTIRLAARLIGFITSYKFLKEKVSSSPEH